MGSMGSMGWGSARTARQVAVLAMGKWDEPYDESKLNTENPIYKDTMDSYGHLWTSMDIYGIYGHLWTAMDSYGQLWTSVDI